MAAPIPEDRSVHRGHGSAASGRLCSCWSTDPASELEKDREMPYLERIHSRRTALLCFLYLMLKITVVTF